MLPGDEQAIDAAVSSTPDDLSAAIQNGRRAWASLGSGRKACLSVEAVNLTASRRSLCAARCLPAGHRLRSGDLVALRPATGLAPSEVGVVLGQRLVRPLSGGEPLTHDHLDARCLPEKSRVA
jgi:sialic acid synthase SpsE